MTTQTENYLTLKPIAERTIGVKCIICDEFCGLDEAEEYALRHGRQVVKVCDDCKEAIKWVKIRRLEKIENGGWRNIYGKRI